MSGRSVLFRRYAVVISAAIAGTVLAAGAIEMTFALRENLQRSRELHVSAANAVFGRVTALFEEVERNFLAVSNAPWSFGAGQGARVRELQRLMRLLPSVADVTFADSEGRESIYLSRTERNRFESLQPIDASLADRSVAGKAVFGPVRHRVVGSAPIVQLAFRDRGERAGVTLVTVNLQFVSEELARMQRREGESMSVVDERGVLVAHQDVGQTLRTSAPRQAMRTEPEGSAWTEDAAGSPALTVWRRMDNPAWTLSVESPWRQVLKPAMGTFYRTLALVVAGVIVSLGIAWLLARRLARPVVALKDGVSAYGAGNLEHRIELVTGDELEDLAHSFNAMAEQLRDYTVGLERKVAEKTHDLQGALKVAQDAMRARALFLAAASHDLRQPLYAISLLADALVIEPLPAYASGVVEKQRHAIAVLRTLFDNLLDLSRFDAGDVKVELRDFPLRDVLGPLAVDMEMTCRAKGLRGVARVGPEWVRCDPELLRRVVGNLLSNAVRYTVEGEVTLETATSDGLVRISVRDTGVGIPASDQGRIFDEFVQLANPARDRDKGVGLGLSIVRRISELLGAPLTLTSQVGVGTCVEIAVPSAVPAVAGQVPVRPERAVTFPGLRAWIVEDDLLVRDALRVQLDAWKVDARFMGSKSEIGVLLAADGSPPDVAVIDDMLGDGPTGLEVAEWLGQWMPRERILLVTGNVERARVEALESSGFVVMVKPVAAIDLADWIRDATLEASASAAP
ncbi:hypothetical protein BWI17_01950 [Betaproteobacteria bacterium GR16-43]|nr:hypothetical protein BWI17_01950 [Betaproteobacteria bacterium GR16-43]